MFRGVCRQTERDSALDGKENMERFFHAFRDSYESKQHRIRSCSATKFNILSSRTKLCILSCICVHELFTKRRKKKTKRNNPPVNREDNLRTVPPLSPGLSRNFIPPAKDKETKDTPGSGGTFFRGKNIVPITVVLQGDGIGMFTYA